MWRDDTAILLDIAHAATLVAKFLTGKDQTAFLADVHAYEAVDYDEVWRTATKDIPELLVWVTPLLPEEPV